MTKTRLIQIPRTYKNNGQHAEQIARFNLTNRIEKADNRPSTECADCMDIQIKGARATVCKGTDLVEYLKKDKANRYAYVTKNFQFMYIMNITEYIEFVKEFGTVTQDSQKNGGQIKIRLKSENQKMVEWLEKRAD